MPLGPTHLDAPHPISMRSEDEIQAEGDTLRLFNRSPHPYHRRKDGSSSSHDLTPQSTPVRSYSDVEGESRREILKDDGRTRRKALSTPSESGTEADDEGYGLIKALPAPPIRPRKGLRDARGNLVNGVSTPFLTPSQLEEDARRLSQDYFELGKGAAERRAKIPDVVEAEREKFARRRRAEIVRRLSETALLIAIGVLVLRNEAVWRTAGQWRRVELLGHSLTVLALLALYPIRLLLHQRTTATAPGGSRWSRLRIPSTFDPASLLYPPFLPVLVALSLSPTYTKPLLPNIVLGLATLPTRLIPSVGHDHGLNTLHWFLSVIPLTLSENTDMPSKLSATKPYMLKSPPPEGLHPETIIALFALHHALIPPLQFLTATSLLPAELQLLSISLVNILLFSEAPQMVILKGLLWLGGLSLFVFCGHVLKWNVTLARVPKWRFRRAGQLVKNRRSFLSALGEIWKLQKRNIGVTKPDQSAVESDADEDGHPIDKHRLIQNGSKLEIGNSPKHGIGSIEDGEIKSAIEHTRKESLPTLNKTSPPPSFPSRRNTLSNLEHYRLELRNSPSLRRKRAVSSTAQSFLSLTPAQASIRKWLYAAYVYIVIVSIILGPIRVFISRFALHGSEPFGWAIGYLFGNIQRLRFFVFKWDFEQWIPLPSLGDGGTITQATLGHAEKLRLAFGEANTRLLISGYCASVLAIGMAVVLRLSSTVEVDTRRKVFHGMMVAMFLPTIYIDPTFAALALALVLAIFLLLDLIRAAQLPPLSKPLAYFLTPYVDGRDLRGPVVVSHMFLLIGCAIPLWLSLAGIERTGTPPWDGWDVGPRDVSMVAGVVCVGMGDAAASLVGRRYGRRKWPWAGGKSIEGSIAFVLAVTMGLMFGKAWLRLGQWKGDTGCSWRLVLAKAAVSACGASFMEAVLTGGNDNVVVPVALWLLVRAVGL